MRHKPKRMIQWSGYCDNQAGAPMAFIEQFFERVPDRISLHGPVRCAFSVFHHQGKTYLQLDTFGSENREFPGKVSQTLQLDEARATTLVAIIRSAFPGAG